jgi:hypothetical protein
MRILLAAGALLVTVGVEPPMTVPRGAAPVIDGRIDDAEWKGAAISTLPDGSTLRMKHDDAHLFLAISAAQSGFPSVCIATGDTIRVLHASAALGSVAYTRAGDVWSTRETAFVYGMRTTDLTDKARGERREYLARHGWVGSTFRMGDGRAQEMQISLDLVSKTPAIALGYFVMGTGSTGSVVAWPASMPPADGCADAELVRGAVPPQLRFAPASWVTLSLAR